MKNTKYYGNLRGTYKNFQEFKKFSDKYGISKMLGFSSSEIAWRKNPIINYKINENTPVAQLDRASDF